jgi:hypothetical protein
MGCTHTTDRTDPAFLPEPTQAMPAVAADALAIGALHKLLAAVLASAAVLAVVGGAALARVGEPGLTGPAGAASTIVIGARPSTSDGVEPSAEIAGAAGCGTSSCQPGPLALSVGPSDDTVTGTAPVDPAETVATDSLTSTTAVTATARITTSGSASEQQRRGDQSRGDGKGDGKRDGRGGGKGED